MESGRPKRSRYLIVSIALIILIIAVIAEEQSGILAEGNLAPDFIGNLGSGQSMQLSSYLGNKNVVLFFYPKDYTAGCTMQVCAFRDSYADVTSLEAVIFGVSRDTESSHAGFVEEHNLPFPLISDPDRRIHDRYGVMRLGGLIPGAKRVTYVIDKTGVIRRAIHHEFSIGNHVRDVVAVLKEIQEK